MRGMKPSLAALQEGIPMSMQILSPTSTYPIAPPTVKMTAI